MSCEREAIQYKGTMNYGHGYSHQSDFKSGLERAMDYEDAMKRIAQLPRSKRAAALREWRKARFQ